MAERRMFTTQVVDSDEFLELPLTAQALYFHLGMRADDDGFVHKPKAVLRTVLASGEDLDRLVERGFGFARRNARRRVLGALGAFRFSQGRACERAARLLFAA